MFMKRPELPVFASRRPGVLAANLLDTVRHKVGLGHVLELKQFRKVDMVTFVTSSHSGLKEFRDTREASTLATIMDHMSADRLLQAVDVAAMPLVALTRAKGQ